MLPLAARLRPCNLDEVVGQAHLLAAGKPLRRAIEGSALHSFILWGPPGVGKTTIAELLAHHGQAAFAKISAVMAGVKDIRAEVEAARARTQGLHPQRTVLFVDEVHRFNKAQQDALLPYVEDGTVTLIGATTENPSFEVVGALLSRCRVYVLKALEADELTALTQRALADNERGLGALQLHITTEAQALLCAVADGDARRLLTTLDMAAQLVDADKTIHIHTIEAAAGAPRARFDKGGEQFYDQISALHKSVRGSDPDAALYWLCRMLDGGCDPLYLARRIIRMAWEDIGLADPRAMQITSDAAQTYERLGSPEGELALAQAVIYLAVAAKSNAGYNAYKAARGAVAKTGTLDVPLQLRNAPTKLMKSLDYGKNYRYAHDEADAFAAGEVYLPDSLAGSRFYQPVPRGLETQIKEKLDRLRALNEAAHETAVKKTPPRV